MKLPNIPTTNDTISMVNTFGGINLTQSVRENQWSDLINVNNDMFPIMATRPKRSILSNIRLTKPLAFIGGEHISSVDEVTVGGKVCDMLRYDNTDVCDLLDKGYELGAVESRDTYLGVKRDLIINGAYLCVFPDGIIYNTIDRSFQSVVNKTTASSATFTPCTYTEQSISLSQSGEKPPTNLQDGMYWFDTSSGSGVLKRYSSTLSAWQSVGTSYIKIAATGIGRGFKPYDAVKISGLRSDYKEKMYNNYDLEENENIVFKASDDYIVIIGYLTDTFPSSVTIKRELPEMEYYTECDNRIWGCNSKKHEIYACKLGDPTNWHSYAGLDSDSYTVTTGHSGLFTGAVTFNNTVMMFMEDGYYRVFGTKPSNYEVTWRPCSGVQYGSSKSLCQVGDYLYYKANDGIVAFDGSASIVSNDLGNKTYYEATGGAYRSKYYCCMRDGTYKFKLYVFDSAKGTWVIESTERIWYMAYSHLGLYLVDNNYDVFITSDDQIYEKIFPSERKEDGSYYYPVSAEDEENEQMYPGDSVKTGEEPKIEWFMTTGDIGLDIPYKSYLKRIDIKTELDYNSMLRVEIAYDGNAFEHVMDYTATRKRSLTIPIKVKRCDMFKIRFSGYGAFKLFNIAKIIENGSDI